MGEFRRRHTALREAETAPGKPASAHTPMAHCRAAARVQQPGFVDKERYEKEAFAHTNRGAPAAGGGDSESELRLGSGRTPTPTNPSCGPAGPLSRLIAGGDGDGAAPVRSLSRACPLLEK